MSSPPPNNYIKLYVAGKWNDKEFINTQIEYLESLGYTITHNWTKVETSDKHTKDELAGYAKGDVDGVMQADFLLTIITDVEYPYRGCCTELGVALGNYKKVFVLNLTGTPITGYHSNIFAEHKLVSHFTTMQSLLLAMNSDCPTCFDALGEYSNCTSCGDKICRTCVLTAEYPLEEWLDVSNKCTTCKKLLCKECVYVCYDCANEGDTFDVFCETCRPNSIEYLDCKYHTWSTCSKHEQLHTPINSPNNCGACFANRNYHERHS